MKSFGPVFFALGITLLAAACNDAGVVSGADPEPDESPTPSPEESPIATPELPPVPADVTLVMQWDEIGDDWELHLVKPGGRINDGTNLTDCTWTTCIYSSPDWGVIGEPSDDPHKDYDDLDQFGPERIWFADPEPGIYNVLVEHWGTGGPESDGNVTIDVQGTAITVSKNDLPPQHVWFVATLEWPSGVVTPSQDVFDCTASWAGGCTAQIP